MITEYDRHLKTFYAAINGEFFFQVFLMVIYLYIRGEHE